MTVKEFLNHHYKWLSGSLAIHCDTKEKAHRLLNVFNKLGKTWKSGKNYIADDKYFNIGANMCYLNNGTCASLSFCKYWKVQVIEFEDIDDFKKTDHLLNPTDFNYLSTLLKPFKSKNVNVVKRKSPGLFDNTYYLEIYFNGNLEFSLPAFPMDADRYTNLIINTPYTLTKLGIIKNVCKFKIGDLVKVTNNMYCYTNYADWFKSTMNEGLLSRFYFGYSASEKRDYVVVAYAPHLLYEDEIVVAIKDVKGKVYLIRQEGLEAIK